MTRTTEYAAWVRIKTRCYDNKSADFPDYGGRGIAMCDRWRNSFEAFYADMGDKPAGTSIDRINNDRGYEPGNCRWATPKQQANNRRGNRVLVVGGVALTMAEWARRTGVAEHAIEQRLNKLGWTPDRAVWVPVRSCRRRKHGQ